MIYHNSQDTKYRDPFGAVTPKTRISLSLSVENQPLPEKCFLRLWNGKTEDIIPMDYKNNSYTCKFKATDSKTPLWYYFILDYPDKTIFYGNNKENLGGVGNLYDDQPPSYQITVYNDEYDTPDWFKKGTVYHIFVDRFNKSNNYINKDRYKRYHDDWHEQPNHTPAEGEKEYFPDDFYGGNLQGIIEKLGYLHDMGISTIYLSPIFESRSNHKYDTGDYTKIDPSFGNEEIFKKLCDEAASLGIRIILDGVFSHTGDDSIYFNKYNNYDSIGAYNSADSDFFSWYTFEKYPVTYNCWWDIVSMPTIDKSSESFRNFICNENGIAARWLKAGASGWRLDVADELPMDFLESLRKAVKSAKEDSLLMGEVWEDASNKVSYGNLRNYCYGETLDSVMNYPVREAILEFIMYRMSGEKALAILNSQLENYPKQFLNENMNLLGSHDRVRLRTILSGAPSTVGMTRDDQAVYEPEPTQKAFATARTMCAATMMFILPGVPHIFYGDEAGLEGMADPFNRKCFPWGNENKELMEYFKKLSRFRLNNKTLINGNTEYFADKDLIACKRIYERNQVIAVINRSTVSSGEIDLKMDSGTVYRNPFTGSIYKFEANEKVKLEPNEALIISSYPNIATP